MAKKKVEEGGDGFDVISSIVKKYGDIVRPATEILDRKLQVFSTGSPNLDMAMGGGIQEGCIAEISGLAKIGKTSLCLQAITSYMKAGRHCYFLDMEQRLDKKNLRMRDMDASKLTIISSKEGKILTANDALNIIEDIVKADPGCAIILDSMSCLMSKERASSEVDGQRRDTRPKLYSDFFCGIAPYIHINRVTLFLIRHMGVNQEPKGKKYIADCGLKVEYYKDISLQCTWSELWQKEEVTIGKIMHFNVLASNFAGPVNNVDVFLRFNHGIDQEKESVTQAIDYGLIERSSSWLTLSYLDEPIKLQGEEKTVDWLRENPGQYQILRQKISEILV